jgi:hypothetical protein
VTSSLKFAKNYFDIKLYFYYFLVFSGSKKREEMVIFFFQMVSYDERSLTWVFFLYLESA